MTEKTLMERMKEETWPQHQQAERQELERALVSGTLPRDVYVQYLGQRYLTHVALDALLQEVAPREPRLAALVAGGRRFHAPRVAEDLVYYGANPSDFKPLPATTALIEDMRQTAAANPIALLGFFYVFEGSTNGARFIARALRRAYALEGTDGTRYLDPYGEEQRAMWEEFKSIVGSAAFTPAEADAIVAAAGRTFDHVTAQGQAVYAASAA
jgi:heme oxygenase